MEWMRNQQAELEREIKNYKRKISRMLKKSRNPPI
jgi:preprotein translocase subunit Sss1